MRQIAFAALGLILTAPLQAAVARDHTRHVRSHAAHAHHAGSLHRHHYRYVAHRHLRHYGRYGHVRFAYGEGFDTMGLSTPQPYGQDFGAISGGYEHRYTRVQRYGYGSYGAGLAFARRETSHNGLDTMISRHAQMNGIPESLLHRVVMRESRYNPRAVGRGGAMGLMQIKTATARAMGYTGSASGLLDAETNVTYAARYLAGAYRAAGGNSDRAVSNYARGYYHQAKAQGFSPYAQQPTFGGYASTVHYRRPGFADQPLRAQPL